MLLRTSLIAFVALLIAACSGAQQATAPPANDSNAATNSVDLSETYNGTNELTSAELTVNYPAGWTAQGSGTEVRLTDQAIDSTAQDGILVTVRPVEALLLDSEVNDLSAILDAITAADDSLQVDSRETLTINGREAIRATGSASDATLITYVVDAGSGAFVLVDVVSASTIPADAQAAVEAVVGQVQYTPGNIPDGGS